MTELKLAIEATNCRVIELSATVLQDSDYIDALEADVPDTPDDYSARKAGDLYPPTGSGKEKVNFVLCNFPKGGGSWEEALAWAEKSGYTPTNPREVFAVARQHDLCLVLGVSWLYLVATNECFFESVHQVVYVHVDESYRTANLFQIEFFGDGDSWFLFRKKRAQK